MRLARGNREHPAVVAEATAVEAADMVVAVKVASEEATRNSHTGLGNFCSPGNVCPAVAGVAELKVIAPKTASSQRGGYVASTF
jgi:hypothetical protein